MAFDAYGRPLRGVGGEPGYFEPEDSMPDYTKQYATEPRDNNPSSRQRDSSNPRKRSSPPLNNKVTSSTGGEESLGPDGVSPELIATITEKIKKESQYTRAQPRPLLTRVRSL